MEEEMVPVDLLHEAKETGKSHLCLCVWQQADPVYTQPWRPNNIFQRRWICFSFCGCSDGPQTFFFSVELMEQMGCVLLTLAPSSRFESCSYFQGSDSIWLRDWRGQRWKGNRIQDLNAVTVQSVSHCWWETVQVRKGRHKSPQSRLYRQYRCCWLDQRCACLLLFCCLVSFVTNCTPKDCLSMTIQTSAFI